MKSANPEIDRQMAGTGKSSLIIPAIIMGTEHATVTKMVRATLRIKVIAVNNLDINKFFRRLEEENSKKRVIRREFYQKFVGKEETKITH
ncbi:hypothetical protein AB1E22_09575 [Buttiauxella gaviniae]|uniref:Helicase/UvrB N-terminal domain-containing protein n=1 Tax=Buttiauxella gaviniae TaxID=82990 RepID=A0ABV3NTU9_9ENTR